MGFPCVRHFKKWDLQKCIFRIIILFVHLSLLENKIPIKAKVNPLGIAKICNINYYTYTPEIFDGFRVFAHLSQGVTILVAEITDCTIFQWN